MRRVVLLILSFVVGVVKIIFGNIAIYGMGKAIIDLEYKNNIENQTNSYFVTRDENFWAENRNSELTTLNFTIATFVIFAVIVFLAVWLVTLILSIKKADIPAGILTIIFISIVIGIIMLVTRRRNNNVVQTEQEKPKPQPQPSKPVLQCAYCDRKIDKLVSVCPYCGGTFKK